jgi:hypothetical protein
MNSESASEWMKIMLEEIARKKVEQEQVRAEEDVRAEERRGRGESNARSRKRL